MLLVVEKEKSLYLQQLRQEQTTAVSRRQGEIGRP